MTEAIPALPHQRTRSMEDSRNKLELALWFAAAVVALIYTYLM